MRFNEAGKIRKMQKEMQKAAEQAVNEMALTALNHFQMNFKKQGFDDRQIERWKRRKDRKDDKKRGKHQYWEEEGTDDKRGKRHRVKGFVRSVKQGRGILIGKGTGVLWRSLRKRKTSKYTAMIFIYGQANRYAKVHNDGLRAGRGKGFQMPKRQFIGDSYNMDRNIRSKVEQRILKAFNK